MESDKAGVYKSWMLRSSRSWNWDGWRLLPANGKRDVHNDDPRITHRLFSTPCINHGKCHGTRWKVKRDPQITKL